MPVSAKKVRQSAVQPEPEDSPSEAGSEDERDEMCEDEEGGVRIGDIYIPPAPRPACTLDTTGPRLIITHIENENFKSYAGKQVLGPLHKSFTAIVGPNGSGKSNVIDSMLFVFGYRAAKIRSKKISVLLHNSDEHQNVRSCTVTVNFHLIIDKPNDEFEVVPDSKLSISRTAFRDNSSFYCVNDRKVQFKEVAKLLHHHGIDLDHNRFLILQGEVEQIAMMKPIAANEHETGMLEFLEDIIGTKRFKEPLAKLFTRVEQLTEEKAEKLARVKLVEKEKDALESIKNEAIQFLQLENEITEEENILHQKVQAEVTVKLTKAEEKKKVNDETLATLQESLQKVQTQLKEKTKGVKEKEKNMQELQSRQDKIKSEFDKAQRRDLALQEDIVQLSNKRKSTKKDLKQERDKLVDIERIPEKNKKSIEELVAREGTLMKDLEKVEEAKDTLMAGLAEETKVPKEKKDKLENELIGLKKVLDETKSDNDITKKELELYLSNEQKEQTKLEQIRTNHAKALEVVSSRKPQIQELEKKIPKVQKEIQSAEAELKEVKTEEATASVQLRNARAQFEETRTAMQATRSSGKVLDYLMNLKNSGKLPGIYGRLGDLGGIEQKYDVAVSTAVGVLDFVVVDNETTGKECIRLLKQHDIGRVHIIILEKQEGLRQHCDRRGNYPENVVRLFDLIQIPDERVRTAFYYGCRETLVAKDMDQATRIGYGATRYRVVTLKGEVIEMSGTMSGGGRPSSGRMGRAVAATNTATPGQIKKMEQNLQQLEERSSALRTRHDELQAQLTRLPTELRNMKMDLQKFQAEIQSAVQQEPQLKEQAAKQELKVKEAAPDPAQVKKLKAAVAKTQAAFDSASANAEKISSKVKKLHDQIMEMTGGRVSAAQKKVDAVVLNLDKVRQEMTKLKVAIKTSERNANKSVEKIANMEQEISEAETNLKKMLEEAENVGKEGAVLCKESDEIEKSKLEVDKEITKLKVELAEISKKENKEKSQKLEIDQKAGEVNQKVDSLRSQLKIKKSELKKLKLHDVPGCEKSADLKVYSEEELQAREKADIEASLDVLNLDRGKMRPNLDAIEEFQKKEAQYLQRIEELDEINARRTEMRNLYEELRKKRLTEFLTGYNIITSQLKEMYQMITLGGDAELELVDSLDPFSEGVIFSVRPPMKSWKNIANLSGGEKTLSSLALVFALHYYKPSPLYVMDEIDAALDFKNVSIVGNYIKERTKNAQFIIISLRANMFELADRLIGIYKTYNATKSVTINPRLYGKQPPPSSQPPPAEASKKPCLPRPASNETTRQKSQDAFDSLLSDGPAARVLTPQQAPEKSPMSAPVVSPSPSASRKTPRKDTDGEDEIPRKRQSID